MRVLALNDWRASFVVLPGDRARLWTPTGDPLHTPELLLEGQSEAASRI